MGEEHHIAGVARGEPLRFGQVGIRVRLPLSGTPSPQWSHSFGANLATRLAGHPAVGHLRLGRVVQGADIVLEGVQSATASCLGDALRGAIAAANQASARRESAPPVRRNLNQDEADRIAQAVGNPEVVEGAAAPLATATS